MNRETLITEIVEKFQENFKECIFLENFDTFSELTLLSFKGKLTEIFWIY